MIQLFEQYFSKKELHLVSGEYLEIKKLIDNSEFNVDSVDNEYKSLIFEVDDQEDADALEIALDNLIYKDGNYGNYHFEIK